MYHMLTNMDGIDSSSHHEQFVSSLYPAGLRWRPLPACSHKATSTWFLKHRWRSYSPWRMVPRVTTGNSCHDPGIFACLQLGQSTSGSFDKLCCILTKPWLQVYQLNAHTVHVLRKLFWRSRNVSKQSLIQMLSKSMGALKLPRLSPKYNLESVLVSNVFSVWDEDNHKAWLDCGQFTMYVPKFIQFPVFPLIPTLSFVLCVWGTYCPSALHVPCARSE